MPTNTLPPGWTGNDGEQTCDIGPFRLTAMGGGGWGVSVPSAGTVWILDGYKWPDGMPEARVAATAALRDILTAGLERLSVLTVAPSPSEPAPTTQEPA